MRRHNAPEITPFDLESAGKKHHAHGSGPGSFGNDKNHGKKGPGADQMKQIGSVVVACWLGGVFILGYDWMWPFHIVLGALDLLTQIPVVGTLLGWVLTPLQWLLGFAYRGVPVVPQMGAMQEPRLPQGQVLTYANSYVQQFGDAALIMAASDGYSQIVTQLLTSRDAGYRDLLNAADENGNTALLYTAAKGFLQTTAILLKSGADPDVFNQAGGGRTPLMEAAGGGHQQIVAALMARKAQIDSMDDYGNTALHYAAYNGHLNCVRELLKGNPTRDAKNTHGETAASYAQKNKFKGIADLLNRPPSHREMAAQQKDADDAISNLLGNKDAKKAGGDAEKKEDDHLSKLMKMFGKKDEEKHEKDGKDDLSDFMKLAQKGQKEKDKSKEEDKVSMLKKLFGVSDEKAKKAEEDDPSAALMKLLGKTEDKQKNEQDDTVSKLAKLFGGGGKDTHADDSKLEQLKAKHEEMELKAQKRIVELMEAKAEHQKAAEEAQRESRMHKLNITEMSFQVQNLQSKVQSHELRAADEKARADQLMDEKQRLSLEADHHKNRADSAERERDMHMDASRRHQERLTQTHAEMSDHLSRLESKQREASQLRDDARQKDNRIADLELELQRLRSESAAAKAQASVVAATEPLPPVAVAATVPVQPKAADSLLDARPVEESGSLPAEAAAAAAAAAARRNNVGICLLVDGVSISATAIDSIPSMVNLHRWEDGYLGRLYCRFQWRALQQKRRVRGVVGWRTWQRRRQLLPSWQDLRWAALLLPACCCSGPRASGERLCLRRHQQPSCYWRHPWCCAGQCRG